jgi:hypothetical protein
MSNWKTLLFHLHDGTPVFKGDILYHPDKRRVGWYCVAEFEPNGEYVTVRSPEGAVPTILISELRKEPPPEPIRCTQCGQLLPHK